jgi:hypothetical protein
MVLFRSSADSEVAGAAAGPDEAQPVRMKRRARNVVAKRRFKDSYLSGE